MRKPVIGILGRVDSSHASVFLHDAYRVAILKSGGVPFLILPPYFDDINRHKPFFYDIEKNEENALKQVLELCDGFLFPGGTLWYGFDQYVFSYAMSCDKPVLGICLGMQLMANYPFFSHKNADTTEKICSFIEHQSKDCFVHSVSIFPSKLKDIVNKDSLFVNSRHSFKVKNNSFFDVSSISPDDVIESIEIPNRKFMIGVQWHPEDLFMKDISAQKLFESFIKACI